MAVLKVFISSTCYDLSMVRSELRGFISNLGHEPVMSEYNDILFDPNAHTHESCISEIPNSDVIILIIGSRFGGKAVPQAVNTIDFDRLKALSKTSTILENPDKISITQMEILRAIEANIPVYAFVEGKVMNDHLLYEKNKDKDFIDQIVFPSIDKRETAMYIFEFINYLKHRSFNNSIFEYSKISDIEDTLKRQWSAQFQRMLREQRKFKNEKIQSSLLLESVQDLKSLILSTISTDKGKEIGKGVLKYRRLIDFVISLKPSDEINFLKQNVTFEVLLKQLSIIDIVSTIDNDGRNRCFLIKEDGTYFKFRLPINLIKGYERDWSTFKQYDEGLKESIIASILESDERHMPPLLYVNSQFSDILNQQMYQIVEEGKDDE